MKPKAFDLGDGYHLAYFEASNGLGGFHPVRIELLRENGFLVKKITDGGGNFLHFPGTSGESWLKELSGAFRACARFNCYASRFVDGAACFSWIVQPDGRYWADKDGFGMTPDREIRLYSLLDKAGNFLMPFADRGPDGDRASVL